MENLENENFDFERSPMKEAYLMLDAKTPEELSKTSRENKGFGSTGHI